MHMIESMATDEHLIDSDTTEEQQTSLKQMEAVTLEALHLKPGHAWSVPKNDQDEVSNSITQTWTDQAIKCYLTNADCANCSIPRGNYSFTCQMNKVVPVLLSTLGAPDDLRLKKVIPYLHHY
jgi:hypothetical protein